MNFITQIHFLPFIFICLMVVGPWSTAAANEGQRSGQPQGDFIQHFDTDGDGMVSQDEFPGPDAHFNRLDQNSDGYIDEDEKPTDPPPPGNLLQDFDNDGDGQLSQDEFPGPDDHFSRLDANGDGFLDADEMPKGPPGGRRKGGERQP